MNDEGKSLYESTIKQYLQQSVSRATLFKASAAAVAAAAIPSLASADTNYFGNAPEVSFPYYPTTGSYTTESISTIVNVAATAETLAVTLLTAAVNSTALGLTGLLKTVTQAALAEEYLHLKFLQSVGGTALTTTFSVPDPKILSDQGTFFSTIEVAENLFVAAYMTATREFAEMGQPTLAKIAYQTGATEAEHRVLARAALALAGSAAAVPPNNKAFETDLLLHVSDAVGILQTLGFVGGSNTAAYPGDAAALAAMGSVYGAIIQKTPNNASSTVIVTGAASLTGERSTGGTSGTTEGHT